MCIFTDILECRSKTVIDYKAEDALELTTDPATRKALQHIIEASHLDEIYATAHEQLGQHQAAKQLRNWLAARKPTSQVTRLEDGSLQLA